MRQFFADLVQKARTQGARAVAWHMNLTPGKKWASRGAIVLLLILPFLNWGRILGSDTPVPSGPVSGPRVSRAGSEIHGNSPISTVASTPAQQRFTPYTVQKGESIIAIAKQKGVPWEAIIVANERELATRASERCAKLSESYTKRAGRRGHYCNFLVVVAGRPMVNANSLQPGDLLQIPSVTAPIAIQQAITNVKGDRIVVVIDDTGSMGNDRERVSSWYLQAVKNSGKQIVRVIMYADGLVRELDAGNVNFLSSGGMENTRSALERAATYTPDAIVLLTDEPGDDWNSFRGLHLPPVIAHSLDPSADANLVYVARLTGGSFLSSHAGPIGLATISPTP